MNTKENNLLIAKFMGAIEKGDGEWLDTPCCVTGETPRGYESTHIGHLEYHQSWSWIMPVVEKIESLGFRFEIALSQVDLYDIGEVRFVDSRRFSTEVEHIYGKFYAIYQACIEFIKWYNKAHRI